MPFNVQIRNFGKLTDATVRVGQLTVLAGANSTGKSFFSKSLYSVLHAARGNHAEVEIRGLMLPLTSILSDVEYYPHIPKKMVGMVESALRRLWVTCASLAGEEDEIAAVGKVLPEISKIADELSAGYGDMRPIVEDLTARMNRASNRLRTRWPFTLDKDDLDRVDACIKELRRLEKQGAEHVVLSGLGSTIQNNLIGNFQVPVLRELQGTPRRKSFLSIEGVLDVEIRAGREIVPAIERAGLVQLQKYSKVIYLETPAHWKLQGALENAGRMRPAYYRGRSRLGVPKYFHDLAGELNEQYSGEVAFPELLERLTQKVMGGKIVVSESGALVFHETKQNRTFTLPMTATGVVNLGILALLIEMKILDKGVFLFIDEPEAHLHPVWQVEMIRALFDLARDGVNVVIATHSADILERLGALAKEKPEARELIALNHFSPDGKGGARVVDADEDFDGQLDAIQKELTEPFFSSYMEAL